MKGHITMAEKTNCPECGADLPANAPNGLCPQCLMKAGMQMSIEDREVGPSENATPPSGFVPPEPGECAAHLFRNAKEWVDR